MRTADDLWPVRVSWERVNLHVPKDLLPICRTRSGGAGTDGAHGVDGASVTAEVATNWPPAELKGKSVKRGKLLKVPPVAPHGEVAEWLKAAVC